MSNFLGPVALAPAGSTGNNSHNAAPSVPAAEHISFKLVVEAVGATPTITWKIQGAAMPDGTAPGANDWVDLMLRPSDTDTGAVTRTATAVGTQVSHLPYDRDNFSHFRLVTSLNTNVTYRGEMYAQDEAS
jgi:hypothetical protein